MTLTPPDPDVVELSVFGRGIGESLVVHVGFGDWMIIDSYLDRDSHRPVALDYLESIGVDTDSVRLVVGTHWHDDHIRGLSKIFRASGRAHFACSAALRSEQFMKLVAAGDDLLVTGPSGVDEFLELVQVAQERGVGARPAGAFPDYWAGENQRLLNLTASRPFPAEVWSLSPSAATITLAATDFVHIFNASEPKRRLISTDNLVSVALWVQAGSVALLLGADLEEHGRVREGWTAIVDSPNRPAGRAGVFKVPHHGSPNGDCDRVWTELLSPSPTVAVTPYVAGRGPRPSGNDLARLCQRSQHVYVTGDTKGPSPKRRSSSEKMMNAIAKNRRVIEAHTGHIRIRIHQNSADPVTDIRNGAFHACA